MTGLKQSYGNENHYVAAVPFNISNIDQLTDYLNDLQTWHQQVSDKLTDSEEDAYYRIWEQLAVWQPELKEES